MKLELKKVTFSEALSEESNAYTADVYLDGKLVAQAKNSGKGGSTDIRAYATPCEGNNPKQHEEIKANRAVMARYEEWAAQQPKTQVGIHDWAPEGFARSLEADVDDLFEAWLKAHYAKKDEARLKRMCKSQWVFTLTEYQGKPTTPNDLFTIGRKPGQQVEAVGKQLREKHGGNLKEFYNEKFK